MLYGKLVDGVLEKAPNVYTRADGTIIINFDQSELYMKLEGYKRVIEGFPEYDANTQKLVFDKYTETDKSIIVEYKVVRIDSQDDLDAILNEEINK